jgi:arylsulfatase
MSRIARLGRAAAAVLLLLAAGACSRTAPAPNLVIVTLDTTRADHLGLYGYFRDTSPVLDAFAREAIVFDRFIVPMATTLPSHTSIFTGVEPLEHGVLANSTQGGKRFVPSPQLHSLAEIARSAGWRTAAFVSAAPLRRDSGIASGFELFDEPVAYQRDGRDTTRAALDWLARQPDGPFLLWVHYYDAHFPYASPPPYATMFATDARVEAMFQELRIPRTVWRPLKDQTEETRISFNGYDGDLRYQDAKLGELLAALSKRPDWGRTAVVILGDHGEGLGQHGEAAHGGTWNEQLHAPLVMRIPGEAPRRIGSLMTAADVIPTLLGRLHLPAFEALLAQTSGRDVLADGARSAVTSQDTGRLSDADEYRYVLTTERWKLFEIERKQGGARRLLFDLQADPFELTDVSAQHPEVTEQLAAELKASLEKQRQRGMVLRAGEAPTTTPANPRLREELKALGYVDDESPAR